MEIAGRGRSEQLQFRGRLLRARADNYNFVPRFQTAEKSCQISFFAHETQIQKNRNKMNKNVSYLCGAALFLGAALFNQSVQAQLNLTGDKYTQDFNAISNGIPIGWSIRTNATAATLGGVTTNYSAAKTWGDTGGEFGNCASTVANSGTNFYGHRIHNPPRQIVPIVRWPSVKPVRLAIPEPPLSCRLQTPSA